MPGRGGTGPIGQGAFTGRGNGVCPGARRAGFGIGGSGRGFRRVTGPGRGYGRGMGFGCDPLVEVAPKEWLERKKQWLQQELNMVHHQLDKDRDIGSAT